MAVEDVGARGGDAGIVGVRSGGRSSDRQLRREESGHALPELSELYTVVFCLLKGRLGGCCQESVTQSVLPEC